MEPGRRRGCRSSPAPAHVTCSRCAVNEDPERIGDDHATVYALVEAGDPEAIDIYLCEQDAHRALEDFLRDEPDWRGLPRVEEIELAGVLQSAN
jgi:hypothetical protein